MDFQYKRKLSPLQSKMMVYQDFVVAVTYNDVAIIFSCMYIPYIHTYMIVVYLWKELHQELKSKLVQCIGITFCNTSYISKMLVCDSKMSKSM